MNVPEEWVPTEAELPADHWSKSPEWLDYKTKQVILEANIGKAPSTLSPFQKVGSVNLEIRKKSTHDIQMEACKVEWIDPNPPADVPLDDFAREVASVELKGIPFTTEQLEEIARTIVERISKVTDAPSG